MEKEFWAKLQKNKFAIPEDHTLTELTHELFSFLGSIDPELRDNIAYTIFANWLKQERYSINEIRGFIKVLLTNLDHGIGEIDKDIVFRRSFSILFLAEIVHNDNKKTLLDKTEIKTILEKCLWYVNAEKDPRGYIPVKGWAHALAHTADLMLVLGKNVNLGENDLLNILNTISEKIINSRNYIYIHGEDERLAAAIIEILHRYLLPDEKVEAWAKSFTDQNWKGTYLDPELNRAFQNTRNLLRSTYLGLIQAKKGGSEEYKLEQIFLDVNNTLNPY